MQLAGTDGSSMCALKSDNSIWRHYSGWVQESAPVNDIVQLDAGYNFTCLLKNNGTVWCWGTNQWGQLGDGTTTDSATPVQASGLTSAVQVSAACNHAYALKRDGTVWGWGGYLDGLGGEFHTPTQVIGYTDVTIVKAAANHVCALKNDGTVWCFGENQYGQLGNGTTTGVSWGNPPVRANITGVTEIALSGDCVTPQSTTCAKTLPGSNGEILGVRNCALFHKEL